MCPTEHPAPGVLTSATDLTPSASDENRPPQECELSSLKWHSLGLNRTSDPTQTYICTSKMFVHCFELYRNRESQSPQILTSEDLDWLQLCADNLVHHLCFQMRAKSPNSNIVHVDRMGEKRKY